MADHDQRLKSAIRDDLPALLALAAPEWATAVEAVVEWLDQELFPDPPAGERRLIDMVARISLRDGGQALAHVEAESTDSLTSLRERMLRYRPFLRNKHGLQVLSVGVYMQVGLEGVGWDEAREEFGGELLDLTRWRYLGLPALDGTVYATGDNLLGVALVGLMRVLDADKPRVKADAMRRLAEAELPTLRRYLLMEMIEAYMPLGGPLIQQYQDLLVKKEYSAVLKIGETTFERGEKQGRRDVVREQLEAKFGTLPEAVARRLAEWPIERVNATARALLAPDATLASLGLVDPT
jgi:hypothetical protein